jgi:hypothetical protein
MRQEGRDMAEKAIVVGSAWIPERFKAHPDKFGWDRVMVEKILEGGVQLRTASGKLTADSTERFLRIYVPA